MACRFCIGLSIGDDKPSRVAFIGRWPGGLRHEVYAPKNQIPMGSATRTGSGVHTMSWNESDSDGEDRKKDRPRQDGNNPWGSRSGQRSQDGLPDLDQALGRLVDMAARMFGFKRSGQGRGRRGPPRNMVFFGWWPVVVLLAAWLLYDMSHVIDQRERGVVLRFGRHVTTLQPGLSLRFPRPIEEVLRIDVSQVRSISHTTSMLTRDENIVEVAVVVQWRISEPEDYLFNAVAPDVTLRQVVESVIREVIGKNELDFIYTTGRDEIATRQQDLIQDTLNRYALGILVLGVEIQSANPPDAVKVAFDDVIKASEDRERLINEAEAYRNDIIPKSRGAAVRLREESNAYKARVISQSEGEASRFEQLLAEYQRAPEVTRQRLYLDAVENVLRSGNKVFINDDADSNSLMYLPLDKIMEQRSRRDAAQNGVGTGAALPDPSSRMTGKNNTSRFGRLREELR